MKTIIVSMIAAVSFVGIANAQTAVKQVELERQVLTLNPPPFPARNAPPKKVEPIVTESQIKAHSQALMFKAGELEAIAVMCLMAPGSIYGEADVLDEVAPYLTASTVEASRAAYREGAVKGAKPKCGSEASRFIEGRSPQIERHKERLEQLHRELSESRGE